MFGKKKKIVQEEKKELAWTDGKIDYLGFKYDDPDAAPNEASRDMAYGITASERTHMAIFGLPGSGKTSILKLLIYQNIMRGQGFMVIDPHGELARDVMSMIPEERHGDVIYVNPASLYRFGKTVQVNPLEIRNENERFVVVMAFVNTLYNLYKGSWGPRLETVLRNAANALVESKGNNTLRNISEMITDEKAREEILTTVQSKNVKHFWTEIFGKQYSKDAGSSAYNKIDKILATPTVSAMFDATESSISVSDIIKNRRMLIVDLSTGTSDDIAEFLGSIFLNMLYVEAKRRIDVQDMDMSEVRQNPFYVYVDEAHMFSNTTMSEMLRALRKFGIKVTIATQTCNAYEREFADEITGVCKTIVTGRCDYNTAQLVRSLMPVEVEEMQRFPSYTFSMFSDEGGKAANAIFRARPVPFPGRQISDWKAVAKASSEKWGKDVAIEKYLPAKDSERTLFTPIEVAIVHLMRFDERDWYRTEILLRIPQIFPKVKEREVNVAIDKLTRDRYLKIMYPGADDGDQNETQKRFVLTEKTYNTYLSKAAGGQRSGGEMHRDLIFKLMDINMDRHRYCVPDLGDKADDAADLLVIEPGVLRDKDGYETYDAHNWSMTGKLAIEVEMDPTKHMAHSVRNYSKNLAAGCDVWFICMNEKHRALLEEAIREKHPEFKKCKMDVIDAAAILRNDERFPDTFNESFGSVKVKTVRKVLRVSETEKAMKEPAKTHYDVKQLGVYNKGSKKKKRPGYGFQQLSGELPQPPVFKTAVTQHGSIPMAELEWKIYELVQKGGFERNIRRLNKALGGGHSRRELYDAVNSLTKKKAVITGTQRQQELIDHLDGNGQQRSAVYKKVLLPADTQDVKFAHYEHWNPADGEKTQDEIRAELGITDSEMAPDEYERDMPEPDEEPDPEPIIHRETSPISSWSPKDEDEHGVPLKDPEKPDGAPDAAAEKPASEKEAKPARKLVNAKKPELRAGRLPDDYAASHEKEGAAETPETTPADPPTEPSKKHVTFVDIEEHAKKKPVTFADMHAPAKEAPHTVLEPEPPGLAQETAKVEAQPPKPAPKAIVEEPEPPKPAQKAKIVESPTPNQAPNPPPNAPDLADLNTESKKTNRNSMNEAETTLEELDVEDLEEETASARSNAKPRSTVNDDLSFDDMTDNVLLAMLSDETMGKNHTEIKRVLEERGAL